VGVGSVYPVDNVGEESGLGAQRWGIIRPREYFRSLRVNSLGRKYCRISGFVELCSQASFRR